MKKRPVVAIYGGSNLRESEHQVSNFINIIPLQRRYLLQKEVAKLKTK